MTLPLSVPVVEGRDPRYDQLYEHTLTLSRDLIERIRSALDVGQSIIRDARWKAEQDELRALLTDELRRTRTTAVPVVLYVRCVEGELRRVGQVDVLTVPDADPQGSAWDVRSKLVYNVYGDEFTDADVSEWEA